MGQVIPAHVCFLFRSVLSVKFDLIVAIAAIDWSVLAWFERYFGFDSALGTNYGIHLSGCPVAVSIAITLRFP